MGVSFLMAMPCLNSTPSSDAAVSMSNKDSSDGDGVAYEGLLRYESKGGIWKERWFVLDASQYSLVKCATSARQRSRSYGSVLGGSAGVRVATVVPVSTLLDGQDAGLDVVSTTGQRIRFLTKTKDDERAWLMAIAKLSHGFTRGVAERLADRELLAGKYALVRELGRGASGVVSLYTCQGKPFAIKKFVPQKSKAAPNRLAIPAAGSARAAPGGGHPTSGGGEKGNSANHPEIPEEVRREIALLRKASHLPHVIKLHDVIVDAAERQYYLVMEYMGGGAIAEWDPERKCYACTRNQKSLSLLDEKTVRAYMTNLLLGIQALHQNGLCHRDIKPENLMANEDRTLCKIGDLGIAHYFKQEANGDLTEEVNPDKIELCDVAVATATDENASKDDADRKPSVVMDPAARAAPRQPSKAMLKSTKGTYQFLPPEALSGDEFDGFQADIWSIGVTLYVLLFGYLPFYSNDLVKLFEKIEKDSVVVPSTCQDDEVKDLIFRILEKNPEKRISIGGILEHKWLHRHVDSKALTQQVRALKRAPALCVEARELDDAVTAVRSRFDKLSRAEVVSTAARDDCTGGSGGGEEDNSQYKPRPIETSAIVLPEWMQSDLSVLAEQLHFDWCRSKHLDGWVYGAARDDSARVHPLLVPMRDLPESARGKNVEIVAETLKCVLALGCHVERNNHPSASTSPRGGRSSRNSNSRNRSRSNDGGGLLPSDHVTLTWDLVMLVDLLAENSHEVWAAGYTQQGWRYDAVFNAETKTHPSLKPYMALAESDKDLCREGVGAVLKSCVCLGYDISCSRARAATK